MPPTLATTGVFRELRPSSYPASVAVLCLGQGEYLTGLNFFPVLNMEYGVEGKVVVFPVFFPAGDLDPAARDILVHANGAVDVGENGGTLGDSGFKKLFNPWAVRW